MLIYGRRYQRIVSRNRKRRVKYLRTKKKEKGIKDNGEDYSVCRF